MSLPTPQANPQPLLYRAIEPTKLCLRHAISIWASHTTPEHQGRVEGLRWALETLEDFERIWTVQL